MSILTKNPVLKTYIDAQGPALAKAEGLDPDGPNGLVAALDAGTVVVLANPAHANVAPTLVGQPTRIKVNANIGTSPLSSTLEQELVKLAAAEAAGSDTVMDLSIDGDLDAIRLAMLAATRLPLGTVPMYAVGAKLMAEGRDVADMKVDELFDEIAKQAAQGVDFVTVHCGLSRRGAELATKDGNRQLGIVSRGGSMLARWMLENGRENPLLEYHDRLLDICRPHNVTLSLGDGLRPGAGCDAGDAAMWEEVINLGILAKQGLEAGVQCMIEGPGHVPLHQVDGTIRNIKRLTNGAPLYVLGPLVCDSTPGYDHIAGAIGGAMGVMAGVDFLCYLTPAEHLTLPNAEDVTAGVMASRVAAHAGEVALGRPWAVKREADMNTARKNLDWKGMEAAAIDPAALCRRREAHKDEEVCAMCGKFCSVKMLRDMKKKQ